MSKKEGPCVRFAVGDSKKIGSAIWRIWSGKNKDHVMISPRNIAGEVKITLHKSGYCHLFVITQQKEALKKDGLETPEKPFREWDRNTSVPKELQGKVPAVSIVIPTPFLHYQTQTIPNNTYLIQPPEDSKKAIVVDVWFTQLPPTHWRVNTEQEKILGYWQVTSGEYVIVVASSRLFDTNDFSKKNKDKFKRARIEHFITPQQSFKDNEILRACIYTDLHENKGVFRVIDIGGIRLLRNE